MALDSTLREPASRVPSYRRHRPSGQAAVTLNGRDIYLGTWNTKASRAEYDRRVGEWLKTSTLVVGQDVAHFLLKSIRNKECFGNWIEARSWVAVVTGMTLFGCEGPFSAA